MSPGTMGIAVAALVFVLVVEYFRHKAGIPSGGIPLKKGLPIFIPLFVLAVGLMIYATIRDA